MKINKIRFITGATAGFGEALAKRFAEAGDDLILIGRREDRLSALAKKLTTEHSVRILPITLDVQNLEQVKQKLSSLPTDWADIDTLVNNAGLALGFESIDQGNPHEWDTMIQTNVNGLLYVSHAIIPYLKKTRGHIINIGSTAAKDAYPKGNVYCATKAAVDMITKTMRVDLLPHGIRVTAIHPGAAETEFSLVRFEGDVEKAKTPYAGYQALSADDVASVIHYCATLPPHFCINDLVMTSSQQANSNFYFRNTQA
jgi:3-hydroxy acid dehydrogenase/malonic semialdehyde reductase